MRRLRGSADNSNGIVPQGGVAVGKAAVVVTDLEVAVVEEALEAAEAALRAVVPYTPHLRPRRESPTALFPTR